jgi:hypothetical protein
VKTANRIADAKFALTVLDAALASLSIPLSDLVGECALRGDVSSLQSITAKLRHGRLLQVRNIASDLKADDAFWASLQAVLDSKHVAVTLVPDSNDSHSDLPPAA